MGILTPAEAPISKVQIVSIVYLCYGCRHKQVKLATETDNSTTSFSSFVTNEDDDMREREAKDAQSLYWNQRIHLGLPAIMKSRIMPFLTLGVHNETFC